MLWIKWLKFLPSLSKLSALVAADWRSFVFMMVDALASLSAEDD